MGRAGRKLKRILNKKKPTTTVKKFISKTSAGVDNELNSSDAQLYPVKSVIQTRSDKYSIVWLARNADQIIEDELIPNLIECTKIFYMVEDCYSYIQDRNRDEKIIFIVNISFGREFVLWVNNWPQISAIYIYGIDSDKKQEWEIIPNKKIMGVATNFHELFPKIIHHLQQGDTIENSNITATTISRIVNDQQIQDGNENSSIDINGDFLFIQTFIQTLLRMPPKSHDRQDLISICRKIFQERNGNTGTLEDFEKNYSTDTAIKWYTKDSLFYRAINEALRTKNIIVIYKLRLFIIDLYRKLEALQKRNIVNPIHLFRTQLISKGELKKFQKSTRQNICMTSFLSTTTSEFVARFFSSSEGLADNSDLVMVLFEIDVDPNVAANAKPFADIREESSFPNEDEYLLMLGSIVHINSVTKKEKENHWVIRLKLCGEDDHNLKDVFQQIKDKMEKETNLFSVGTLLYKMGKYREAEEFYNQLLNEPNVNDDLSKAQCYKGLSAVFISKGDYDSGLSFLEIAIFIFKHISNNDRYMAESYRNLAICYTRKHNNTAATEYFRKALDIYIEKYGEYDLKAAEIYLSLSAVFTQTEEYDDALLYCMKALKIFKSHYLADHRLIGSCYCNLGFFYYRLKQYDLSLDYYEKHLEIVKKTMPTNHYEIGVAYLNMGEVFEEIDFYNIALSYYEKANDIFHKASISPEHGAMIELQQHVQSAQMKLNARNKLIARLTMLNK